MSTRSLGISDSVFDYLLAHASEPPLLTRLREETARLPEARMQISPEQGAFLGWLMLTLGARRTLEVGVFTGYSSLAVALALPSDGHVLALDVSDEWTRVARRYWREAGVSQKVELELGHAIDSLDARLARGEAGTYDFAFVDADKENYPGYYERAIELLRPGGVLAVDNTLWSGKVADPSVTDAGTVAIRAVNERARTDSRVRAALAPIGDGLLLVTKCRGALAC